MSRFIFRKIGGRIIPIVIGSVKDPLHIPGRIARKITASAVSPSGEKTQVGVMNIIIPKKGVSSSVGHTAVDVKFQRHGISKAMFQHSQELLGKVGKKFIRTDEIHHVAQVKIRSNAGRTQFFAKGMITDETKKVGTEQAKSLVKHNILDGKLVSVSATTMIPRKFRGIKKK